MLAANKLLGTKIRVANEIDSIGGSGKFIEKFIKSKTGKLSKLQKLAKSKKPSKSENSSKFHAKEARLNYLITDARLTLNYL